MKEKNRFVSDEDYQENLRLHEQATRRILSLLTEGGAKAGQPRQLEFFFYADNVGNAKRLVNHLHELKYSVDYYPASGAHDPALIAGCTTDLHLSEPSLVAWAKEMSAIGYHYDCDFDGWGTLIE